MSDDQAEAFDLNSLSDEELVEQVHDDLYNGLKNEVIEATNLFLGRGWGADRVLNDALVEGMRIVGIDFRDGILFVPETVVEIVVNLFDEFLVVQAVEVECVGLVIGHRRLPGTAPILCIPGHSR